VEFQGLLLSNKGLHHEARDVAMTFWRPCLVSLNNKRLSNPPKFAIANGLFFGQLPARFADTTATEHAMLNLAQPTRFLSVVRGGRQSTIRSHAYLFRATPAPPAKLLPRELISTGLFRVTMVGAMTPDQKLATMKKYQVRAGRLQVQLEWYSINNHSYNQTEVQPSTGLPTRIVIDNTAPWASRVSGRTGEHQYIRRIPIVGKLTTFPTQTIRFVKVWPTLLEKRMK
jgi:hypothetical protein